MTFNQAIAIIAETLSNAGTNINVDDYDGAIIKKLAASNTLDAGRTTNQTHIAITGPQMDIFPYLCADGYFYEERRVADVDLKKYFVIRIPVTLYERNLKHLGYEGYGLPFDGGVLHTTTAVVRSKRGGQADQLQVSMLDMDGEHFVAFRRLMHEGTYFVLLKRKAAMSYDAFGILPENAADLGQLNNKFFKKPTNTVVDAEVFNTINKAIVAEPVPQNLSIEELGHILRDMYDNASAGSKVSSIHMFGIKYGQLIRENNYKAAEIIRIAGINESYNVEVSKGISIYKSIKENEYGIHFSDADSIEMAAAEKKEDIDEDTALAEHDPPLPVFYPRTNKQHPLNCILYGAPGTGKTYATAEYALAILENRAVDETPKTAEQRKAVMEQYREHVANKRIVFTTFHQSYGYEDFIQGLRPVSSDSGMEFIPVDGVFKRIADRAIRDPGNNYVIIIDEINRANISKVFGELITLIEDDKRWGEVNALQVTLPSGDPFAIPNNLYIVGTMNSADKSISLIDTALRRRFEFIEVVPNAALIADSVLRSVLEKLNTSLVKELDSTDLLIGHAYFVGKSENELCSILNRSIIPLLYEYFYDNSTKVKAQIKNALPSDQYVISGESVGRIKVMKALG